MRYASGLLLLGAIACAQTPKIVDAHVHHNGSADFLKQLVATLEKHDGIAFLLVKPEHLKQVTDFIAQHPGRLVGFGDISPDDPKVLEQIDQFHKAGFRGLGEISSTRKNRSCYIVLMISPYGRVRRGLHHEPALGGRG